MWVFGITEVYIHHVKCDFYCSLKLLNRQKNHNLIPMGFIHLDPNAVTCLASLWTLFTWPQLVFSSSVLRSRALLTWPTAWCAPITVSIGLWKTCWNIPVSRPNLRRPLQLFHDHYATVQTFSPNSYHFPSPQWEQTGATRQWLLFPIIEFGTLKCSASL